MTVSTLTLTFFAMAALVAAVSSQLRLGALSKRLDDIEHRHHILRQRLNAYLAPRTATPDQSFYSDDPPAPSIITESEIDAHLE